MSKTTNPYQNLGKYNLVMGIFHLVQGFVLWLLSSDFSVPVNLTYLKQNTDSQKLELVYDKILDVQLGPLIASFLFLSAIAHFSLVIPPVYKWYIQNLKKGANYARWIEYSVSSSLMVVAIGFLNGMYDLGLIILLFGLNMSMIFFGWMMELHNQTTAKIDWTSFIMGCITGVLPWVVITLYFVASVSQVDDFPKFIYGILASLFIFFNIFAINMYLQYKQVGPWKNYTFGEKMYIFLSLFAKSALAWQVWAGTLRGES